MPKLKDLKIKGTNNLRLGKTSRPELRSLEIISGGLPTEVVEDILGSDFPNLEKLILFYKPFHIPPIQTSELLGAEGWSSI